MRVYKFLDETYGLKSIEERRLKISRLNDLNDPFDLLPFDISDKNHRRAMKMTLATMGDTRGVMCFSAKWRDPVLWAHYSDKHRGICLGFDIPDGVCRRVVYVHEKLKFPHDLATADNLHIAEQFLFTKYASWQYEEEVRVFTDLEEEDDGMYFKDFDESLQLMEIIAGARCNISRAFVQSKLSSLDRDVNLVKARAGFKTFEVVVDQRGFRS